MIVRMGVGLEQAAQPKCFYLMEVNKPVIDCHSNDPREHQSGGIFLNEFSNGFPTLSMKEITAYCNENWHVETVDESAEDRVTHILANDMPYHH